MAEADEIAPVSLPDEASRKTWKKNYKLFKSLFVNGSYELITAFEYQGKNWEFRTLVQPDADIIQYLPPFDLLKKDRSFQRIYLKKHRKHQAELSDALAIFQPNGKLLGYIIDGILVLGNIYSGIIAYQAGTIEDGIVGGVIATVSILYRQFLKKPTIKTAINLGYKLLKQIMKWRKG